jgi:hypothetical protein
MCSASFLILPPTPVFWRVRSRDERGEYQLQSARASHLLSRCNVSSPRRTLILSLPAKSTKFSLLRRTVETAEEDEIVRVSSEIMKMQCERVEASLEGVSQTTLAV